MPVPHLVSATHDTPRDLNGVTAPPVEIAASHIMFCAEHVDVHVAPCAPMKYSVLGASQWHRRRVVAHDPSHCTTDGTFSLQAQPTHKTHTHVRAQYSSTCSADVHPCKCT